MIKRTLITAVGLAVASWLLPGITLADGWTMKGIATLVGVALVFGIINAVIKPLFKVLTGCLVLLTFGLFLLVINAAMMLLTSYVCGRLGLGWQIAGTSSFSAITVQTLLVALEGSLIVSVVSFLASKLLKDRKK